MAAIQLLVKQHNRDGFDCGDAALNEFLQRQAGQQQRSGFGKTYVALAEDGAAVIGFVTVSAGQIATASLPAQAKLPRHPAPILRIGRLAVDVHHQGKGIGQDLLAFALRLAVEFSQRVGLYAVVVDAKHDKAKAFYTKLGFIPCMDNPLALYLPVATLEQASGA
ncbi:MAG: GNAT family N-acetyltransferase [Gallionella sp.]|nr:GNAT family N-acetyltransferase [Gallionella sp.]MDD4947139.1 GNAT family N-acetyltransferase [Gallionella sp.]